MKKEKPEIRLIEDYYYKKINKNEKEFTSFLQGKDILPNFRIVDDTLIIEAYPMTLKDYIQENCILEEEELGDIPEKIKSLIDKIHSLGIFHCDIHPGNIVLKPIDLIDSNPNDFEVRLIDFELSRWIETLSIDDMEDFMSFLPRFYPGEDCVQDLLNYEYEMWKYDYFL
jgi:serine/threonine protein kinase